ncbi:hypothetical protein Bca52824_064890 [Brassica carinata]|uniref:Uncharacterized protein n=1 Tax=Brassica carinata TaxID=52824 RepID=A0A8X7QHD4_BRACI|nr:hypothetical protein Bca52824_064890 [Brassica carinata]
MACIECIQGVRAYDGTTANLTVRVTPHARTGRRIVPNIVSEDLLKPVNVLEDGLTSSRSTPIFCRVPRKMRSTELPVSMRALVTSYSPIPRTTRRGSLWGTSEPTGGWSARRVSLGSESSEIWSPPVAVGLVLKRRRRICWGRLVWPSELRAMIELMKSAAMGGAASGVGVGSPPGAPKVASS